MIKAIYRTLIGDSLANAREAVKDAMKDLSRREAEANYHRMLRDFHEQEASNVDPAQEWWVYAQHKQDAFDHSIDADAETYRVRKAEAKVTAAKERLHKLQGQPEQPSATPSAEKPEAHKPHLWE